VALQNAGYDLTFSAPKSVSVIEAIASPELRKQIDAALFAATDRALKYAAEEGFVTARYGLNGTSQVPVDKLTAMTYLHDTSRMDDPQKHLHVILANLAKVKDHEGIDRWLRIDCQSLFQHKIELGAVWRAELAQELIKLGFSIERDKTSFRIVGVPPELEKQWSKGGAKIEDRLIELGLSGSKAKNDIALSVRGQKSDTPAAALREGWREEAAAFGLDEEEYRALLERTVTFAEYDENAVIEELSQGKATFDDLQLRKAVAIGMQAGGGGIAQIREAMGKIKQNEQLIELVDVDAETQNIKIRWTTKAMREAETELVGIVDSRRGKGKRISEENIISAITEAEKIKGFHFSPAQRAAIHHICRGSNADKFLEGVAGAGKSTLALAVRIAMEKEGRQVIGMALASKAATGLADGTGIEASTIDKFLLQIENPRLADRRPKAGTLILVDESNMSDTRQVLNLLRAAKKHDYEVAFVGDRDQLQAIKAGSVFQYLYDQAASQDKAAVLESTRQRGDHADEWRKALHGIREGKSEDLLKFVDKLNNLEISQPGNEITEATARWAANRAAGLADHENIFVTNRNDQRKLLNDAARQINGQAERLDNVEIKTTRQNGELNGLRSFAPGDRIIGLKNETIKDGRFKLQFENGRFYTVEKIKSLGDGHAEMTIRDDKGKRQRFTTHDYAAFESGYALTTHQAEGVTAKGGVTLPTDLNMMNLHSWYTMLTRFSHAEYAHVVIPDQLLDEAEEFFEVEKAEGYQPDKLERMTNLLKAVEKRAYDRLSISFPTKEEYEAKHGPIDQSGKAQPKAPAKEITPINMAKLPSGEWGVRLKEPAEVGTRLTVPLGKGGTRDVIIGEHKYSADAAGIDFHFYEFSDVQPRTTVAAEPIESTLGGRRKPRDHQATPEPSETETTPAIAAAEAAKREAEAQAAAQQRGRGMRR